MAVVLKAVAVIVVMSVVVIERWWSDGGGRVVVVVGRPSGGRVGGACETAVGLSGLDSQRVGGYLDSNCGVVIVIV